MSVKDVSHVDELLRVMAELENTTVEVGVLGKAGSELLMIAGVHEFGCDITVTSRMRGYLGAVKGIHLKKSTKQIRIPERSFIRAGYDANKGAIGKQGDLLIKKVVDFSITPKQAANTLGEVAKGMIQEFAVDLSDPPNADVTIENKGSSNPLVDTGRMIGAIDYEVKG